METSLGGPLLTGEDKENSGLVGAEVGAGPEVLNQKGLSPMGHSAMSGTFRG